MVLSAYLPTTSRQTASRATPAEENADARGYWPPPRPLWRVGPRPGDGARTLPRLRKLVRPLDLASPQEPRVDRRLLQTLLWVAPDHGPGGARRRRATATAATTHETQHPAADRRRYAVRRARRAGLRRSAGPHPVSRLRPLVSEDHGSPSQAPRLDYRRLQGALRPEHRDGSGDAAHHRPASPAGGAAHGQGPLRSLIEGAAAGRQHSGVPTPRAIYQDLSHAGGVEGDGPPAPALDGQEDAGGAARGAGRGGRRAHAPLPGHPSHERARRAPLGLGGRQALRLLAAGL